MKKKKPDIDRLTYPLWFRIVFFVLTIIVPFVLIAIEGFSSPSTIFKVSFGVISIAVVAWAFIKHFIIAKFESRLRERQAKLEHDYEIDVGDKAKIKWIWYGVEQKLAIFQALSVVLYGGLFMLIVTGVASALMSIKGAILAVAICYVVAYAMKFLVITTKRGVDKDYEDET